MKSHLDLSIVVPVYNEEENIAPLYTEITDALANLGLSYEIIVVNDGSQDGTMARLRAVQERDRRVVVIDFRRNFGQTAALSAGFDHSNGEVIITLDGDLQNDPRDIPLLLDKIKDYDIVNGWRKNRQDKALSRKLPSKIANKLISWVTGVKLNDYGCTLKAYRKDVIKTIKLYGEMHRFIPAIASAMGITYCEVPTHHRARRFGKTKIWDLPDHPGYIGPHDSQVPAQLPHSSDPAVRRDRDHERFYRFYHLPLYDFPEISRTVYRFPPSPPAGSLDDHTLCLFHCPRLARRGPHTPLL